ncbi:MAG: hypothetical protein ACUVRG_10760 [Ignavibacterium sp.]|uniref:hypothetical protein n=1 Tax=Ignavibacterium sp. TaxID=2651167 RepID=UPI004048FE81
MTKEIFENIILDLIKKFNSNPFSYFYEEDLRTILAFHLSNSFNEIKYKVRSDFAQALKINEIYSNPIKCEYPRGEKKGKRFDIVYIDDVGNDFYNCKISIAVELKLGSPINDRAGKFKKDIEKLQNKLNKSADSNFLGIALYFYQGDINLHSIQEWFPQIIEELKEIKINKLEKIYLEQNKVNVLIISKNSLFILHTKSV